MRLTNGKQQQAAGLQQQQAGYQIEQQAAQTASCYFYKLKLPVVSNTQVKTGISISRLRTKAKLRLPLARQLIGVSFNLNQIFKLLKTSDGNRCPKSKSWTNQNEQRARSVSLALSFSRWIGYVGGFFLRGEAPMVESSGQSQTNLLANQQALGTGESIYASNASITQAISSMNDLQTQYALQQADNQRLRLTYNTAWLRPMQATRHTYADTQTLMAQRTRSGCYRWWCCSGLVRWPLQLGASLFSAGPKYLQCRNEWINSWVDYPALTNY